MQTQWEAFVEIKLAMAARAVEDNRGLPPWMTDHCADVEDALHNGTPLTWREDS